MKTYEQLTYALRCQIFALNKIGMSQNKIAKHLNINQSTISRKGKAAYSLMQISHSH